MKKIRLLAVFLTIFILMKFPVFADGEPGKDNVNPTDVVTEYYSEDLMEPLSEPTAAAAGIALDIKAKGAVLMEAQTGEIIYALGENEVLAPASITKIMSILLYMEALDANKMTVEDVVTTSEHAAGMGGSQIWLEPGETMTVHELLKATIIGSANDATTALAEHVAGSEEGFVALMNERAKQLGMKNTNFKNCTGLDEENHYTTAYDVALMSRELIKHEKVTEYSTIWMDSLRGGQTQLVNTNKLVRFYEGCTGLKTGTTSAAGHCLSASAARGGLTLIAVVLGSPSGDERFGGTRKLLDHGFANYSMAKVDISDIEIPKVKVIGGMESKVKLNVPESSTVLISKGSEKNIKKLLEISKDVTAPVRQGQVVGTITVKLEAKVLCEIPITAAEDVGKMTFGKALLRLLNGVFKI